MEASKPKIRLAVLTSSRADFGIYMPLLRKIQKSEDLYELKIIAFGTHLSKSHGYTIDDMVAQGFKPHFEIATLLSNDRPEDIATAYALTALKFADFWSRYGDDFDFVLCLGDRFEMAAAVAAGIPFGIRFAHIHGGETTLGAIDNIYRHCITLASTYHFVAAAPFKVRIKELTGSDKNAFVTGSLSLDNLDKIELPSKKEFKKRWQIDLDKASLLITVHPETVAFESNKSFAKECRAAFADLVKKYQLIITMPNADTNGSLFRNMFVDLKKSHEDNIHLVENFGIQSYFACMKHSILMIGNTSSGIVEAASFGKYVINLGDRQKGRLCGENIVHVPFQRKKIIAKTKELVGRSYYGKNVYKLGNASDIILRNLKL